MQRTKRGILLSVLILAVLSASVFLFAPFRTAVVAEGESGSLCLPCRSGDPMVFEFEHSMYHVPQREYYRIGPAGFTLEHVFFGNARAASYYDASDKYTFVRHEDGTFEILDMDQYYPELRYALAHGTNYTLTVGERVLNFNETLTSSIHFRVYITKVSVFTLLRWE